MYVQTTGYSYFAHQQNPSFEVCITGDQLQKVDNVLTQASVYAKDYETDGIAWWAGKAPCGASFAARPSPGEPIQAFYVPYRHRTGQIQAHPDKAIALQKKFDSDPSKAKVFWNRKFDDHMGRVDGIRLSGPVIDSMMEARLYNEDESAGLKHRGLVDLGDASAGVYDDMLSLDILRLASSVGMTKTAYLDEVGYSTFDVYLLGQYAAMDAALTLRLREFYEGAGLPARYRVSPRGPEYWGVWDIEMALTEVLTDMEEVGVPIDIEHLHKMHAHLSEEKQKAEYTFFQQTGLEWFKLGSDVELRDRLQYMGCKLEKETKGGKLAVDADVLRGLLGDRPELKWVLRYRDVDKLLSTYSTGLLKYVDEHGILHGDFQQMGTVTGRLSCRNPNLQNIPAGPDLKWLEAVLGYPKDLLDACKQHENPKRLYAVQRPPTSPMSQEWFGSSGQGTSYRLFIDYSQVELRVLAHYTQDPRLLKTYWENGDIHDEVERAVFGTGKHIDPETGEEKNGPNRRKAKVINFGLSYCMSPIGFARKIPEVTPEEAEHYFNQYNVNFPFVEKYRQHFWAFIATNGCCFDNMFGRSRRVPGIVSGDRATRERFKRMAIATLIQGTAAEFTKQSIVFINLWLRSAGMKSRITGTVHDEIQIDGPIEEFAEVCRTAVSIMEHFPDFAVPVTVDAEYSVTHWGDKHPVAKAAE